MAKTSTGVWILTQRSACLVFGLISSPSLEPVTDQWIEMANGACIAVEGHGPMSLTLGGKIVQDVGIGGLHLDQMCIHRFHCQQQTPSGHNLC